MRIAEECDNPRRRRRCRPRVLSIFLFPMRIRSRVSKGKKRRPAFVASSRKLEGCRCSCCNGGYRPAKGVVVVSQPENDDSSSQAIQSTPRATRFPRFMHHHLDCVGRHTHTLPHLPRASCPWLARSNNLVSLPPIFILCTSSSLVGLMSQMRSTTSSGMRVSALEPKARAGAVARPSHCRAIPGGLTFFHLFCTPCPCSGSGLLSLEPPLLRNPRHVSSERVACWPGLSPFCSPSSESSFLKRSFLPIWVCPARALWRFVHTWCVGQGLMTTLRKQLPLDGEKRWGEVCRVAVVRWVPQTAKHQRQWNHPPRRWGGGHLSHKTNHGKVSVSRRESPMVEKTRGIVWGQLSLKKQRGLLGGASFANEPGERPRGQNWKPETHLNG